MRRRAICLGLVMLLVAAAGVTVQAQSGGGYDLSWWTVDGGGGTAQGGGLALVGTVGQPDPGPALSGGGLTLTGGFWTGLRAGPRWYIYLPLVVRESS
jgi:hypothetical protein